MADSNTAGGAAVPPPPYDAVPTPGIDAPTPGTPIAPPPTIGAPAGVEEAGFEIDMSPSAPSFGRGLAVAIVLGLLAAIAYALVAVISGREFAFLALAIGWLVALGFTRFGHVRSFAVGAVSAVLALVFFGVAVVAAASGISTKEDGFPFFENVQYVLANFADFVSFYFEDPLSYVFAGVTVVVAFVYGAGLAGNKKEAAAAPDAT